MPRSPVIATPPPGVVPKAPLETIASSGWNSTIYDVYDILNLEWPVELLPTTTVAKGGTGATTAVSGKDALSTKGSDLASAATTNIWAATGDYVVVTGTATITSMGANTAGWERTVVAGDAFTLTHNATSLIIPGGSNITAAAGDVIRFRGEGGSNARVVGYQRATGEALVGGLRQTTLSKTASYTVALGDNLKTILANATSAAITITLPAAATAGNGFVLSVQKTDSSANAVTIDGNGSETINGATTHVLSARYASVILICNGTSWSIQANLDPSAGNIDASQITSGTLPIVRGGTGQTTEAGMRGVYTGTSASNTNFPIGSIVLVNHTSPTPARNAAINIEISATGGLYLIGSADLAGTWRARGAVINAFSIAQRVA